MRKKVLAFGLLVMLVGCSEKKEYEQAVLEQMKTEKDIQDYKISAETMSECVVKRTSSNMPGFSDIDPFRLKAYTNYAKMLTLTKSTDAKKALEELRQSFGSAKDLADAHSNYTESIMECLAAVINEAESKNKASSEETK